MKFDFYFEKINITFHASISDRNKRNRAQSDLNKKCRYLKTLQMTSDMVCSLYFQVIRKPFPPLGSFYCLSFIFFSHICLFTIGTSSIPKLSSKSCWNRVYFLAFPIKVLRLVLIGSVRIRCPSLNQSSWMDNNVFSLVRPEYHVFHWSSH